MSKISELSDGGALQSTDYLIAVRSGGNVKVRPNGAVSGTTGQFSTSLNVDGTVTADGLTVQKSGDIAQFTNGTRSAYFAADSGGFSLFTGAGQTGNGLYASEAGTYAAIYTNSSEKVRITSAGNVGIGTSSPVEKLYVNSSSGDARIGLNAPTGSDTEIKFFNNGTVEYTIGHDDGTDNFVIGGTNVDVPFVSVDKSGNVGIGVVPKAGGTTWQHVQFGGTGNLIARFSDSLVDATFASNYYVNASNVDSYIATGAAARMYINDNVISFDQAASGTADTAISWSEAMRIDADGRLLVGGTNTNPAGNNVDGIALGSNGRISAQVSGNHHRLGRGQDGTIVAFHSAGGEEGSISISGSITLYNTSSDYRLKDVDGPITNSGAYIDALKPVQGSWKVDGSRFIGLIAHEVQEVSETQIATGEKDGEEMQGMDYSAPELIANLIAEIQSLRARVAQLEGA